jgi:hypothetical protein
MSNSEQYSEEISGNTIAGSIVAAPASTEMRAAMSRGD